MNNNLSKLLLVGAFIAMTGCSTSSYKSDGDILLKEIESELPSQVAQQTSIMSMLKSESVKNLVRNSILGSSELQISYLDSIISGIQYGISGNDGMPEVNANSSIDFRNSSGSSLGINAALDLDIWGSLDESKKIAFIESEMSINETKNLKTIIASSVIKQTINYSLNSELYELELQKNEYLKTIRKMAESRHMIGGDNLSEIRSLDVDILTSSAQLQSYKRSLGEIEKQISMLIGRDNNFISVMDGRILDLSLFSLTDLEFPAKYLLNRNDVYQAYQKIMVQQSEIKIAKTNLYPSVNLRLSLTGSGKSPVDMLISDPLFALSSGITGPLFDSGRLKKELEISSLEYIKSVYEYKKVLMDSVLDIENKINSERHYIDQLQSLNKAYETSLGNEYLALSQYMIGSLDLKDYLGEKVSTFETKISALKTTADALKNRVDLALSIGSKY